MNEQWEMCICSLYDGIRITKYSPQGVERETKRGVEDEEICQLLAEGWEPYASAAEIQARVLYFRRCIS